MPFFRLTFALSETKVFIPKSVLISDKIEFQNHESGYLAIFPLNLRPHKSPFESTPWIIVLFIDRGSDSLPWRVQISMNDGGCPKRCPLPPPVMMDKWAKLRRCEQEHLVIFAGLRGSLRRYMTSLRIAIIEESRGNLCDWKAFVNLLT